MVLLSEIRVGPRCDRVAVLDRLDKAQLMFKAKIVWDEHGQLAWAEAGMVS